MAHQLFPTVDALLAPAVLSAWGVGHVDTVERRPLHPGEANSGSTFFRIETNHGGGPRYVLKCIAPAPEATESSAATERNRTIITWQAGVLDRLPSAIAHAVVGCAQDGAGYAILMQDVSDILLPEAHPFTVVDHHHVLAAMAAMHAAFWDEPQLRDPTLGLGQLTYFYTMPDAEGWAFVEQYLDADAAKLVRRLLQDPRPLYEALSRYPATLVHNDLWWANLGIMRDPATRVVMLDWDVAAVAPPAVDLAYYIGENTGLLPVSNDAVIAAYHSRLRQHLGTRVDAHWWRPQLELCLLGCFLRRGKWILLAAAHSADEQQRTKVGDELRWWTEQIRRGVQHL